MRLAALLICLLLVSAAPAQCPHCGIWHPPFSPGSPAQRKADDAARLRIRGHKIPGHPLVVEGATHEGCGQTTEGPNRAIQIACYWGEPGMVPIDIGYAKGTDGWWYSVVGYRQRTWSEWMASFSE